MSCTSAVRLGRLTRIVASGTMLLPALPSISSAQAKPSVEPQACAPVGYGHAALLALKDSGFVIADTARRAAFALELVDCLDDPDPAVRDGIAFEALQAMMRGKQLGVPTVAALRDQLVPWLTRPEGDGFARPFAALVLADVARTDRIEPWMSPAERSHLVRAAADYLTGVRDYRGFDAREGWRHGVAHGADLLMQLAYNPTVTRDDLLRILDAVASQVAPAGHFYVYGESERLAAPVLAVARRGVLTNPEWDAWFARVSSSAPLAEWADAFRSQDGLAKRHNTLAFLSIIYINAKLGGADAFAPLLPGVEAGIRALP